MTICYTLEAPLFLRALKKHCWSRHLKYRRIGQGRKLFGLTRNEWPHKERLIGFPCGDFYPASHRKLVQSSCHTASTTQRSPPHCNTSFTMKISTANLLPAGMGEGVPMAVSPPCRSLEQHPLPTGCLVACWGPAESLILTREWLIFNTMWEHNQECVATPRGFPNSLFPSYSQTYTREDFFLVRDREGSSSHSLLVSQAGERRSPFSQRGQKLTKKQLVVTARHSQPASQRNRGSKQLSCSPPCP